MNPIKQPWYWRKVWLKFNWEASYRDNCERMAKLLEFHAPKEIISGEAHMILEAHYRGRWRMVWGVFKKAASDHYGERYWPMWEWLRTRVSRRPQNEAIAEAERVWAEEESLSEMAEQL